MSGPKGMVADTFTWKEWMELEREHPAIRLNGISLAEPCTSCKAMGGHCQYQNEGPWVVCEACKGRGYLMTQDGKALAGFIQVFGSDLNGALFNRWPQQEAAWLAHVDADPLYGQTEYKGAGVNNAGGPNGEAYR